MGRIVSNLVELIKLRAVLKTRLRSNSATFEDVEAFKVVSKTLLGGVSDAAFILAQDKISKLNIPASVKLASMYSIAEDASLVLHAR